MATSDPRGAARRLITAIPIGLAGAALTATFTQHTGVAGAIASSIVGGLLAGIAAWLVARETRLALVFLAELGVVAAFGPVCAGIAVAVQGIAQGTGGAEALVAGPAIIGTLGIACGWFITVPLGAAFGGIALLWAWIVRRAMPMPAANG